MEFTRPLVEGRLVRRYKRFLADVELADGDVITAHCPNTGALDGCRAPGSRVWLSESDNPARKYRHTWELVEARPGVLVGINTRYPNDLVAEALAAGRLPDLGGTGRMRREVTLPGTRSRLDFVLEDDGPDCYLEVKNVNAAVEDGVAYFPDAVSERAARHVSELAGHVEQGHRAAVFFCVQRADVHAVRPATHIDPRFAEALASAAERGVELHAWKCRVETTGITLDVPVEARVE